RSGGERGSWSSRDQCMDGGGSSTGLSGAGGVNCPTRGPTPEVVAPPMIAYQGQAIEGRNVTLVSTTRPASIPPTAAVSPACFVNVPRANTPSSVPAVKPAIASASITMLVDRFAAPIASAA